MPEKKKFKPWGLKGEAAVVGERVGPSNVGAANQIVRSKHIV